jgi:hypothetical protein
MTETFRMDATAFADLCAELSLENGRSVSKELQLAIFLLIVPRRLDLRLLRDRVQRAKDTASKNFKVVLSKLIHPNGFYSRHVRMSSEDSVTSSYIVRDTRFAGYFEHCIGAVDGTQVPIL